MNKNPVADFSDKDIIKKFHWLLENGMNTVQAAETIKDQTDIPTVHVYLENYLKEYSDTKQI